ncbi:unnamed protein product [Arabis nemorensis]|uniref:F-box associated beta-propeller type 3 domain-containing protein n=1 Tax=Arabis nemorensis TaxID=586526 RepID=A0A565AVZ9_9BRAS|nr:unnamed protein product [Arabis nemorensis]
MSSPALNQDMIIEILSRFPVTEIGKSRLMNKECNKRSHESWFFNLNLHRTNSISGYLVQYNERGYKHQTSFVDEMRDFENKKLSIDFLPQGKVKIEACDSSHGVLLCLNETGPSVPDYIVCKPTTRQYRIIPNPIMQNCGISFGLAVIGLDPFRYEILRLSRLRNGMNRNNRTFACEVYDSDSFTWKRLKNLRLPKNDGLILSNPVQASGFLHWLSREDNVIRFCLKTETWSFFKTPNFGVSPKLVRYEGKLGVIRWSGYGKGLNRLWVLKSSFEKSWVKVKDIKNMGLRDDVLWTPSNDVVTLSSRDRVCYYNTNTEKLKIIQMNKEFTSYVYFPFCSDYEVIANDSNPVKASECMSLMFQQWAIHPFTKASLVLIVLFLLVGYVLLK